jgi:hypothetical protein
MPHGSSIAAPIERPIDNATVASAWFASTPVTAVVPKMVASVASAIAT